MLSMNESELTTSAGRPIECERARCVYAKTGTLENMIFVGQQTFYLYSLHTEKKTYINLKFKRTLEKMRYVDIFLFVHSSSSQPTMGHLRFYFIAIFFFHTSYRRSNARVNRSIVSQLATCGSWKV